MGDGELVSARLGRRRFTKRDCPAKRLVLDGKVGGLTGRQAGRQGRGKPVGRSQADRQTEGKAMHFMIEYSEQRSRGRLLCIACLNHKLTAVYMHTFLRPRCKQAFFARRGSTPFCYTFLAIALQSFRQLLLPLLLPLLLLLLLLRRNGRKSNNKLVVSHTYTFLVVKVNV